MKRNWESLKAEHDPQGMFEKIDGMPEHFLAAGELYRANEPSLPKRDYSQILLIGMGGSAIGGDIVAAALNGHAGIPILVSRGYTIPSWCGRDTLVVATSYSGGTEETLSAATEAIKRGAGLAAITTGGRLGTMAEEGGFPVLDVPEGYPPRTAIAYLTIPALLLMETLGIAPSCEGVPQTLQKRLAADRVAWNLADDGERAEPVRIAEALLGTFPVIYGGGGEMTPVIRRWSGQFAENGKTLAHRNSFPELNHNEIVGWEHPADTLRNTSLIFLDNEADHPRVKKGMNAAAGLLSPLAANFFRIAVRGESPLERIFSSIYLGDMISYYISLGNGVNPTPVQRIDKLKSELAR